VVTAGPATARPEPGEHREDVIRRLLERGLSPTALLTLFPGWGELIGRLADDGAAPPTSRLDDPPGTGG
jgi:hypothetical protein